MFFGFSRCPKCKHRLKTKNLIPIVSYFLQR
ncbi:prepilin peptidase [Patescibacteria group bacterium]|nr:prepilin peptidase [Patescibacteria group bacterium]MBU1758337.1 prepilin peptidase [Patescibacteria group bacterium]